MGSGEGNSSRQAISGTIGLKKRELVLVKLI
jgi:hypothetical protein